MDDSAKFELEQRVKLYEFYVGAFLKGIVFYLAITGLLLKFAVDNEKFQSLFAGAGLICHYAILIYLVFGFYHEPQIRERFIKLAETTKTETISTSPLHMLLITTAVFWVIIDAGWVYIFLRL